MASHLISENLSSCCTTFIWWLCQLDHLTNFDSSYDEYIILILYLITYMICLRCGRVSSIVETETVMASKAKRFFFILSLCSCQVLFEMASGSKKGWMRWQRIRYKTSAKKIYFAFSPKAKEIFGWALCSSNTTPVEKGQETRDVWLNLCQPFYPLNLNRSIPRTQNKRKVQTSIPKYCPFGPTDPVGDSVNGGPLPPITWD